MQPYELQLPSSRKEINDLRKDANAMIMDARSKKRALRKIPDNFIPSDSFDKTYNGKRVHLLELTLKNEFRTIIPHMKMEENHSPQDLWTAKNCADEVRETYGLSGTTWHRIKIGIFVGLIIGIIVVTFMIVTAATGGTVA